MGVEELDALAPQTGHGLGLRFFHGVQDGVQQVERDHHQHARFGAGSLELPGNARGVARDLLAARLRVDAVRLDVTRQADVADGVRIRVGVAEMRAVAGVRVGEDDFRSRLEAGADGLGEGVGGLDGHVDRLGLLTFFIRVKDQRHLRQARDCVPPGLAEGRGQLQRNHLGTLAQDGLAHFDGELQAAGHHRKIREAAAPEVAEVRKRKVGFGGHSGALPLPEPG